MLTVIAILGILVLLAAPKFLGYAEKANIVKIQSGIKAVETAANLKSLENPEFTKDWVVLTPDKLEEINDSGKLIDKNGFIKENLDGGKNVPLKDLDNGIVVENLFFLKMKNLFITITRILMFLKIQTALQSFQKLMKEQKEE